MKESSHREPSPELMRDVVGALLLIKKDRNRVWPPTMQEVGDQANRHSSSVFWVYRALAAEDIVSYVPGSPRSLLIKDMQKLRSKAPAPRKRA